MERRVLPTLLGRVKTEARNFAGMGECYGSGRGALTQALSSGASMCSGSANTCPFSMRAVILPLSAFHDSLILMSNNLMLLAYLNKWGIVLVQLHFLTRQPYIQKFYRTLNVITLHAWKLSSVPSEKEDFLERLHWR